MNIKKTSEMVKNFYAIAASESSEHKHSDPQESCVRQLPAMFYAVGQQ